MRRGDTAIYPGVALMEREFTFHVARANHLRRRFWVDAGLLSGWHRMRDFRWDSERRRWVHNDLPLDAEA